MLDSATRHRLFGVRDALEHPVVAGAPIVAGAALFAALVAITVLTRAGRIGAETSRELLRRTFSWCVLAPLMLGPVLLGSAWVIAGVFLLSLFCYREYARVTGLFRMRLVGAAVALGIGLVTFAALDHWYGFFTALAPLGVALIAVVAMAGDEPKGYVQRVALGVLGFLLFGVGLGHLGFLANDADYRPILVLVVSAVQLNDVFAFLAGKALGRRRLCRNTSPGKTVAGALFSLAMTTTLVVLVGRLVFAEGAMSRWPNLLALGAIASVSGQLGDLMLSSIKRDVGRKDTGRAIPGHGGLLDRFDSLLLAAPAIFHFLAYVRGIGDGQARRIFTGGGVP